MDYNFVIFGSDGGFYKTAYSDIMELNSVIYRESLWGVNNKITALIYKLYHTSRLPNRHLPFKNLLYRAISDFHFSDNRPVCFLSFGRNIHEKTYPFLFYLKRNYPDAKFAIYYQDLIATHPHTDINWIKQRRGTIWHIVLSDPILFHSGRNWNRDGKGPLFSGRDEKSLYRDHRSLRKLHAKWVEMRFQPGGSSRQTTSI